MANFLFILRESDNEKATRCFQFAKIAYEKGHHVDLFFIDSGVEWAIKGKDGSQKTTTGDCIDDYLPFLIENEISVGVCTPCANNRNLKESQFNSNMKLDNGGHLIDMAAEAKIFNF